MFQCRYCGNAINDLATVCPRCGAPVQVAPAPPAQAPPPYQPPQTTIQQYFVQYLPSPMRRKSSNAPGACLGLGIAFVVIAGSLTLLLCIAMIPLSQMPRAAAPAVSAPSATPIQKLRVEFVSARTAKELPGSLGQVNKAKGIYVIVTVKMTNASKEPIDYLSIHYELNDAAGSKFKYSLDVSENKEQPFSSLNPGLSFTRSLAFDLPATQSLQLTVSFGGPFKIESVTIPIPLK